MSLQTWSFAAGAGLLALLGGAVVAKAPPAEELTGGATTVYADGRNAFSFPAANLDDAERTRFAIGNSFFAATGWKLRLPPRPATAWARTSSPAAAAAAMCRTGAARHRSSGAVCMSRRWPC